MMFVNILIMSLLITKVQQSIINQKLVYQVDMSEHCKRRVLPSIFLAKNSVETNAFVMHFSQIELPYSCPISVRAESGNNIIMVIRLSPLQGMKERCEANTPELLVHEMGETFGGYWGPLGKNVLKQRSVEPKIYTLKTTQSIPAKIQTSPWRTKSTETTKTQKAQDQMENSGDENFINVEIPLVNVSGKFVFTDKEKADFEEDEDALFDLKYNVTPESGVNYATSVIPIVQFSIKSHPGWRKEGDDGEPRFDLDIVEKYTPDHRLTIPYFKSTTRLKFRKSSPRTTIKRRHQYFRKISTNGKLKTPRFTSHKYTGYVLPTTKASKNLQTASRLYSWKTIEELINKVNLTASLQKEGDKKLSDKKNKILQDISDMKHNFSIYLKPNLTLFDSSKSRTSTTLKIKTFSTSKLNKTQTKYTTKEKTANQVTSTLTELINQTSTSISHYPVKKLNSVPSEINENYYLSTSSIVNKGAESKTKPTQMPDKSLVDHESWENVVQAAPDMAVLLNKTKEEIEKHNVVTNNGRAKKSLGLRRKKREIHAIEILNASPHNVTTQSPIRSTSIINFGVADMQEFSQLVELRDDELYGRVALRFLRQYVGPVLYNICDFNTTAKKHHVHLFNTSRIVIAINNFTNFAGLTLVLTSARALVAGEIECPDSNVECQVAGARVCIDAMSACDGVPNCGSYDIYDEDRLMCGSSEGLQHNVYIAAFTFLAVLLTFLYSVHYWLRRCVPKVADAFFIYTDGIENMLVHLAKDFKIRLIHFVVSWHDVSLFLEPRMRSPHDLGDETPKVFYHPSMLDADDVIIEDIKSNCCKRFMSILCCGLTVRKSTTEKPLKMIEHGELFNFDPKVKYSFAQLEIQKIMGKTKMSIQSIDNIELMCTSERKIEVRASPPPIFKSIDSILTLEEPLPEDYKDELEMLKFFKTARKLSSSSESKEVQLGTMEGFSISLDKSDEIETKDIDYNRHSLEEPGPSGVKPKNKKEKTAESGTSGIQTTKQVVKKPTSKRLRFNDNTTMITESIVEVDEDEEETEEVPRGISQRHSTFLDTVMGKQKFFGVFDDDNGSNLPKEFKRFWGGRGKTKKPTRNQNTN